MSKELMLEDFLNDLLSNLIEDEEGMNKVMNSIKENFRSGIKFEEVKVEPQVFTEEDNYSCNLSISSENYDDGEILFIDSHIIDDSVTFNTTPSNDVYIVETTNKDDCVYEKYNGPDLDKAKETYNEFSKKKRNRKVELYKRTTLELKD